MRRAQVLVKGAPARAAQRTTLPVRWRDLADGTANRGVAAPRAPVRAREVDAEQGKGGGTRMMTGQKPMMMGAADQRGRQSIPALTLGASPCAYPPPACTDAVMWVWGGAEEIARHAEGGERLA